MNAVDLAIAAIGAKAIPQADQITAI